MTVASCVGLGIIVVMVGGAFVLAWVASPLCKERRAERLEMARLQLAMVIHQATVFDGFPKVRSDEDKLTSREQAG